MKILALALAAALLSGTAQANDGIAAVSAGGIVFRKTDAIAMKKEVLNVSHDLISVDYEFINESMTDVEETIVFPLPAYPVMTTVHDSYYGQPAAFSILVNGKPVAFTSKVIARLGKRDVTAQLKKIGLSDAQIGFNARFKSTKVPDITAQQWKLLEQHKLLAESSNSEYGPAWDAQVNYVWKQTFPANQVVRVHHAYRPFVAAGPGESWLAPGFSKRYCADSAFFGAYEKIEERQQYVNAAHVAYILKTGNTWKNGIEDFTLNVIKRRPEEIVSLCFPGTFKKIDAATYQVKLKNFKPARDLQVFFGNVDGSGPGNYGVMPVLAK